MRKCSLLRALTFAIAGSILSNVAIVPLCVSAANGHDDPGTQVTNNASATYQDANNNSYTTTSNTVTTTVQNAPTLTNTAGSAGSYAPAQTVTDTFTLANTGNASGVFQISGTTSPPTATSDAVIGGSDSASATLGNGAATCTTPAGTQSAACKYAATVGSTTYYFTNLDSSTDNNSLDYWLKNTNPATAAGSSITVNVFYTLSSGAATPGTVSSTIFATTSYPLAGSAPLELSASQSATQSNTVSADARLDLYKSSVQNGVTGDITYTISVHDGGAFPAKDLLSVKALLGAAAAGILVVDKVPQFGGSALKLSNSGTVTVSINATYGYASGAVADTYYTTSANGAGGWVKASGSLPTDGSVTYIAVFLHGGTCTSAGFELCVDSGHPTTPGNANVASAAAVQFTFVVQQPAGPGSANANAVLNLANGVIGDNQPTEHILGPGIPGGTADSGSSTPLTTAGQGLNNTTLTSVNGASNQIGNQALAQYAPLNGPLGQPGSSGTYDGNAANSTTDDFTAYPFGLSGDNVVNTATTPGTPATTQTLGAGGQTLCIPSTLKNNGNHDDSFNVTAYAPTPFAIPTTGGQSYAGSFSAGGTQVAGWQVGVYSDSACSAALGGATNGAVSSSASNVAVTSGTSLTYYVKYIIPAGAPYFVRFDSLVHAVSVADNTKTNDTHNESVLGLRRADENANRYLERMPRRRYALVSCGDGLPDRRAPIRGRLPQPDTRHQRHQRFVQRNGDQNWVARNHGRRHAFDVHVLHHHSELGFVCDDECRPGRYDRFHDVHVLHGDSRFGRRQLDVRRQRHEICCRDRRRGLSTRSQKLQRTERHPGQPRHGHVLGNREVVPAACEPSRLRG